MDLATILSRVREAGVRVRPAGYTGRLKCPDGHIVDSRYEYEVDQWLCEHSIEHSTHPPVPWWNGGKNPKRADFLVGDFYVEIWGLAGRESYDKRRQAKIASYKEHGTKLIQLFPHHIIDSDWSPLQVLLAP